MNRPWRYSFRLLWTILVVGAAAEIAGRFVFGLGNPVLVQVDPACGYILKPDQHVIRFFARTDTNRYGMRSAPVESPKRKYRVMFVGDSLTYGTAHVDQRDIFAEIIGRELGVEVLNASAGAWAVWNEVEYVRSRGIFDADRMVLVLNDGDLYQPPATYADASRDLPVKQPPCALCELWSRGIRPKLFGDPAQDAGLVQRSDARQLAANLAELNRLVTVVKPSSLVVVFLPFRKDLANGTPPSDFGSWARGARAEFLDLTALEEGYPVPAITLDGAHLNKRGNRVVATAIEKVLKGAPLRVVGGRSAGVEGRSRAVTGTD